MKPLKYYLKYWASDYRHYIALAITLGSLGCGFLFPNALPRIAEGLRDLLTSFLYYIFEVFSKDYNPIVPTVNALPTWEWAPARWERLKLFPFTWDEFRAKWSAFWRLCFKKENFLDYTYWLGDAIYYLSRFLVLALPLVLLLIFKLRSYTSGEPRKFKGDSKPKKAAERFLFKVVYPVVAWIKDFIAFLRENPKYWQSWLLIWTTHFNLISIVIGIFAYFFYFSVSFDFLGIYAQVVKLSYDLAPIVRFLPGFVWLVVGLWIYNYICRSMAFARLYHYERCNRAFLKERGIVTTVYGEMGTGKTQLITSMALSAEVEQWDNAFKILLECDLKFPNFPWQRLRDYLRREIEARRLVDLDAVKARFRSFRRGFDYVIKKGFTPATWKSHLKENKFAKFDYTFGYDFEHYRYTYNDELKIWHLHEVLSDYAQAYLIFTVGTSLLFSNYSIRVDSILKDAGNMPLRDNDFFQREPELQKALSRQCHIINYDMLRLGKRMQKEFKLSFGVYVITEIDKERKNSLELQEDKRKTEECNQKNDLFNACLMMCRHAAVVANRVFIRIIADLQRPEAWGAGGRELGEVIYIEEKGELYPCLPIISPYWLCQGVFSWLKDKWSEFHAKYIYKRRDGTLFSYTVDNLTSQLDYHYNKVNGLFGTFNLKLQVQSGRMDGNLKNGKWHIMTKKDRSNRYKTDCLESVFATYEPNRMHVDDFICYAGEVGTLEENGLQNSYFQNDIRAMHKEAA